MREKDSNLVKDCGHHLLALYSSCLVSLLALDQLVLVEVAC